MTDDQFAAWQKYWRCLTQIWILPFSVGTTFLNATVHWMINKQYLFGPHLLSHLWGDLISMFSIIGLASLRATYRRAIGLLVLSLVGGAVVIFSLILFPNLPQPVDMTMQAVQGFSLYAFFGSLYYLWKTRSVRNGSAQPIS